ncbi:HPP family protein [Streptomyces nigra]|uniref:CBS domain-containing protein n=1 Tax=Streptomyces nigra TaxID=1827580 RepID=UPI0036C1A7CB
MMTRIVGEVMTGEVVEARRETPAGELARLLDRHRIGGLPVLDHDDKVVGVMARTDLAGRRARCTAAEVMSTPAVTVHPEQRVAAAVRVMDRHRVDRLPVVDEEDRLIGIIRSVWRVDGVVGVVNHLTGLTDLPGLTTEAGPGVSPGRRRVP